MSPIRITEYSPLYASGVADMWNASGEGWNGRIFNSSAARVMADVASSSYLNLYLAVEGEVVLGYAKLTDYAEEAGVAYIELLNVVPSHHGRGIGRDLVKQCVLRAAELGYGRIDLFTWSGNTKAVPLYKKCGFFWEKMDNQSTHLMNFLPGLLKLPLLKPWWKVFEWYEDCRRELSGEPDGRNLNGFDLYDYIWEKDGQRLEISFERFGRGIVALRTPEYSLALSAEHPKPVFGIPLAIRYSFQRLSGPALSVSLEGVSNGIIRHEFQQSHILDSALELESECFPAPLQRKLSEWESCPQARTVVKLNGLELPLGIGLKVQYPLSAELGHVDSLLLPDRWYRMFINLESHFESPCQYQIEIPEDEHISLKDNKFSLRLEGRERRFIELEFKARQACVFAPRISVKAAPEGGQAIDFGLDCSSLIHLPFGRHAKDTPEDLLLVNALNDFRMNKVGRKNYAWTGHLFGNGLSLMSPQPGKPFSEELESMPPYETIIRESADAVESELRFRSKDIPGLDFAWIYRLRDSGLVEVFPRVISRPEGREDLWLKLPLGSSWDGFSFFFDGEIVETESDQIDIGMCDLPRDCPQENWLLIRSDDSTIGLIWPENTRLAPERYWMAWEVSLDGLAAQGLDSPPPLQIHLDVFKNAWQLRNAAQGRSKTRPILAGVELSVNDCDPILKLPCRAEIIQRLDMELKASYHLESTCATGPSILSEPENLNGIRRIGWDVDKAPAQALELIKAEVKLPHTDLLRGQLMLYSSGESGFREEGQFLSYSNGRITIKAAGDARLPGLISLTHKGLEYLDCNYPDYATKSFYNPFPGGLAIIPVGISSRALLNETHRVEEASITDKHGNVWTGLALRTKIERFEPRKGLEFRQLYLSMSGLPVLMLLAEIIDHGGKAQFFSFNPTLYRKISSPPQGEGYLLGHKDKGWQAVRHCEAEADSGGWYEGAAVTIPASDEHMQLWALGKMWITISQDPSMSMLQTRLYTRVTDPLPQRTSPIFMIFSSELYDKQMLGHLLGLELEV